MGTHAQIMMGCKGRGKERGGGDNNREGERRGEITTEKERERSVLVTTQRK